MATCLNQTCCQVKSSSLENWKPQQPQQSKVSCFCVQSSNGDDICPRAPAVDSDTHLSRGIAMQWPLSFQLAHSPPCHQGGHIIPDFSLFKSIFLQLWHLGLEMTFCSLPTSIRKVASFYLPELRLDFVTPVSAQPGAADVSWGKRSLQNSHTCLISSVPDFTCCAFTC